MAYPARDGTSMVLCLSMIMNYEFTTDDESRSFCDQIVACMVEMFNITEAEAVGKLNKFWGGLSFIGPRDLIYHEDEQYWANVVYYECG